MVPEDVWKVEVLGDIWKVEVSSVTALLCCEAIADALAAWMARVDLLVFLELVSLMEAMSPESLVEMATGMATILSQLAPSSTQNQLPSLEF